MAIILGTNQYGKAENRVVRIYRDTARHEIRDLNVSSALRGDFAPAHLDGRPGGRAAHRHPEADRLRLRQGEGPGARSRTTASRWPGTSSTTSRRSRGRGSRSRSSPGSAAVVDGAGARPHLRAQGPGGAPRRGHRRGHRRRTQQIWVTGGLKDLVILKSTGSEFAGFLEDPYTILAPTHDRVMATSLVAKWRFTQHRRRLGRDLRGHQGDHGQPVRHGALARPAADPLRDGQGGARGVRRGRRGAARRRRTSTTSSTTSPRSAWRTPARSSTPTTARTA